MSTRRATGCMDRHACCLPGRTDAPETKLAGQLVALLLAEVADLGRAVLQIGGGVGGGGLGCDAASGGGRAGHGAGGGRAPGGGPWAGAGRQGADTDALRQQLGGRRRRGRGLQKLGKAAKTTLHHTFPAGSPAGRGVERRGCATARSRHSQEIFGGLAGPPVLPACCPLTALNAQSQRG